MREIYSAYRPEDLLLRANLLFFGAKTHLSMTIRPACSIPADMPLALSDDCLREVFAAAALVPVELRGAFLEAVAAELGDQSALGPGNVHRIAFAVARRIAWDVERETPPAA
jgi:hypothetical protein